MREFQFIHAADLHLGAPFVGLHQSNPCMAQMADEATYAAFDKIIQLAITRKVLFVLFSGDIYDADYPNLKAQLRFRDGITQLDKAGIQSCVIRGNHDHGGSVHAKLEFPDSYFEFAPGVNEPHYISTNEPSKPDVILSEARNERSRRIPRSFDEEPGGSFSRLELPQDDDESLQASPTDDPHTSQRHSERSEERTNPRVGKSKNPPKLRRFESGDPSVAALLQDDGGTVAAIYGYSYPQRAVTENILQHYDTRPEDEKYFRIGMLHGNVGGDAEHDNYAPCSIAQLKEIDIHYWALGHVHQAKVLSGTPAIVYPGTPQGLSPRETGEHGCYLVTVNDRHCQLEFVSADSLRWVNVLCDIENCDGEGALLQRLEARLQEVAQSEQREVIARITLTGRGELHSLLRDEKVLQTIGQQLNAQLDSVWVDTLQDATRPDIDLDKKRQENNLLGDYLRLCQAAKADEELQAKVLLALGDICDYSTVREALGISGHSEQQTWLAEQLPKWLEQAEIEGADLLLEDAS